MCELVMSEGHYPHKALIFFVVDLASSASINEKGMTVAHIILKGIKRSMPQYIVKL